MDFPTRNHRNLRYHHFAKLVELFDQHRLFVWREGTVPPLSPSHPDVSREHLGRASLFLNFFSFFGKSAESVAPITIAIAADWPTLPRTSSGSEAVPLHTQTKPCDPGSADITESDGGAVRH
jgi:hypothetical protein